MAIKKVLRMGHPILRLKAAPLGREEILSQETQQLFQDMLDTMKAEEGIGIAAPQIGVSKQVALIGIAKDNSRYPEAPEYDLLFVINPVIKVLDEQREGYWEGCLSVPGLRGFVERPRKIQVDFDDAEGESRSLVAEGFMATVFQHEIDHLAGTLYIDKVTDPTKLSYLEEFAEYLAPDQTQNSD